MRRSRTRSRKILEREPDWSALPAATPAAIRRLLLRCLAKDPKQRLRDIGDVRIEIDAIDEVLPGMSERDGAPAACQRSARRGCRGSRSPRSPRASACGRPGARRHREDPLANAQFTRFTDWEGTEEGAEISPDGKFVAFVADHDGEFDLWLSQVGTGRFHNLTRDISAAEPPAGPSSGSSAFPATGRRSGSVSTGQSRGPTDAHAPDRRHAAGVPGRGRHRPLLVSRRHPPRLLQ